MKFCPPIQKLQRRIGLFLLASLSFVTSSRQAQAHHSTGHGASESVRILNAFGTDLKPRQRLALIEEVAKGTAEPDLNVATGYSTSALLQTHLLKGIYLSYQLPLLFIDQLDPNPLLVGLGDSRLGLQWNPGTDNNSSGSPWTLLFNLGIPTRTYKLATDPGRQWLLTGGMNYSRNFRNLSFYTLLLGSYEFRPAGGALDISPGFGIGASLTKRLQLNAGMNLDIRAINTCKLPNGSEFCPNGRPSESEREVGATRAYGTLALSYELNRDWTIFGSGQLPFTAKRDIEWGANLGVEWRFDWKL